MRPFVPRARTVRLLPGLLALALLPLAAQAEPRCDHSQPRELKLDLAGVKAVVFESGSDDLHIVGSPGARAEVRGRACASDAADLAGLRLSQRRAGDKLIVRAERETQLNLAFNRYAYMQLHATVPDSTRVQLKTGSGDVDVDRVAALSIDVGSGDIKARRVRGLTVADVGSGDVDLEDIGALQVISLGSGDLLARGIGGDAKLGSVGSGDVALERVGGSVTLDRIGSGDLEVRDVRGDLRVRSIGSGDVKHAGVAGRVDLPKDD
ncbi:DUF4097 family beta strand repeat-containing protein [Lysobacter firmicutimachus]|uniref:DUF4097 family beta strand repeat-containing protein n=1 Tax=Lysobacter firmicutimachus TaxID=1792846 RepID=A0ABU8D342_9GAMM